MALPGACVRKVMAKTKKKEVETLTLFEPIAEKKYKDTKFFSAKQKEKAYKCFSKVLLERDINKMDHNLYEHLHLHCGFIAHYSIHGFKAEYSGLEFRRFVEHFDRNSKYFANWYWAQGEYADVNQDMVDLATSMAPQIYAELDQKQRLLEIELCKALAEKHNLRMLGKEATKHAI